MLGAALLRGKVGCEEGDFWCFVRVGRVCAFDDGEASAAWEICFEWLEGVDLYSSLVEAAVADVGFLRVGKKGVACSAMRLAAW